MKKLLFSFAVCLLALTALPVFAQEASTSSSTSADNSTSTSIDAGASTNTPEILIAPAPAVDISSTVIVPAIPAASVAAPASENILKKINTTKSISYLLSKGQALIKVRLNSLKALEKKINAGKLSADQKATTTAKIDDLTGKLTNLSAQIKAGTDLETVRAQVQSIYADYRVYAVFIPQINSDSALYALSNQIDALLNDTIVKIQAQVDAAKAKGQDTTAKQAALDNANAKLPVLKTQIQALIDKTDALTPADYPTSSKPVLTEVRSGIKDVRGQLVSLRNSIKNQTIFAKVKAAVKNLVKNVKAGIVKLRHTVKKVKTAVAK